MNHAALLNEVRSCPSANVTLQPPGAWGVCAHFALRRGPYFVRYLRAEEFYALRDAGLLALNGERVR